MNVLKYSALCLFALEAVNSAKLKTSSKQSALLTDNLIVNGGFESPVVATPTILDAVPGWTGSKKIEIGKGNTYNSRLSGNTQVAELDPNENTSLTQIINRPYASNCSLSIKYAGREGDLKSGLNVYFNNKLVISDNRSLPDLFLSTVSVSAVAGANQLRIDGTGISDSFGIVIDDVSLKCEVLNTTPTPSTCNPATNFIVNGDFQSPSLGPLSYSLLPSIAGWTSNGTFELGKGWRYNLVWGDMSSANQVIDLDKCRNDPIWQSVLINRIAECRLVFDHAATQADSSNGIIVYFNGNIVYTQATPLNRNKQTESIVVTSTVGENRVAFKGTGTADNFGHTIDNVQLYCKCPDIVTTPPPTPEC
jgi:hypothetical protein